jgi:anaerobic magnesium-protoporphyrin IX monomethyl ester cyclase
MKILLAGPDYEENLSIRYLSASLLSGGHDTILAAFNSPVDASAVANAAQCADLVGLSMCFQARAREFLGLAQRIKSNDPKKVVVAGGHYAACAAEPLLANHPEIDIIVIHEGERTLVDIADAMPHLREFLPEIPGIAYRDGQRVRFTKPRPMLEDLDALPFPDRRGPVHWIAGVPTSYLMGSRGCYGSCAYCCITTLHRLAPGKRFRQRDVERIADEMSALYQERGTRQFIFHDDNFLVPSEAINHARISAFEKALKQRGVKDIALVIKCRPADANQKVLRRLKALGLVRVFLGVESATARGLAVLERNQTVEQSERALETCSKLDISAQFTLMTFNPDATVDTLRSDVAFMRRFCGNPLNFCRTEIYTGTPLEKRMIEFGRARGDYRARVYSMLDPVADLACNTSLDLFHSRCWSSGSLMQKAIGLDHTASVLKRFYKGSRGEVLARRVGNWVRSVNLDTIDLLDEVIELSASAGGGRNAGFQSTILALTERESMTRQEFLSEGKNLRAELEALRFTNRPRLNNQLSVSWPRLAKQAAAALLVIGIPTTVGNYPAMAQQGKTAPPVSAASQDKSACSLAGVVTDPTGAVLPKAKITITNVDTGMVRTLTTDETGQYATNDLGIGHYSIKAETPGLRTSERTGIVLQAGTRVRVDLTLWISDIGCCEYAAVPLAVEAKIEVNLYEKKKKPFTYVVGDGKDNGTLQGIAKLVYGDSKAWIQIFEANRNVILKPEGISYGTVISIPPRKRVVPKLISKVTPVYPPSAAKEHVWGDVLLDVTLKEGGTVEQTSVIDGNPLLVEAATSAVKQWRYQPLLVDGKPVVKFVVAVSFGKGGRVR